MNAIADTAGKLGAALVEKHTMHRTEELAFEKDLHDAIRSQALLLATSPTIDIENFVAGAFEGICRLISD